MDFDAHETEEFVRGNGRRPPDDVVGDDTLRDVLMCILTSESPPSRKEIARQIDRSPTTVSRAVSWLLEMKYIHEDQQRAVGRSGRRETPLILDRNRGYFIGLSIRARRREVAGVLMDLGAQPVGKPRHLKIEGTDEFGVVATVARIVKDLTKQAESPSRILGLGVAMGGHVDGREGLVRYSWNFTPPWKGVSLRRAIQAATGLPTALENNANALALYEQWFGQGRGLSDFAVVWVDVGVGFGIVSDGQLRRGATGLAGELGHWRTKDVEYECECGRKGCLEAAISRATDELAKGDTSHVVQAGKTLGRALAIVQLMADPARIILCSGHEGLATSSEFRAAVAESFEDYAFPYSGLRDLIVWGSLENQKVARGAGSIPLRHLTMRDLVKALD